MRDFSVGRTLQLRTLDVRLEQRAQLEACTKFDVVRRWHDRAVIASSADEALATDRAAKSLMAA